MVGRIHPRIQRQIERLEPFNPGVGTIKRFPKILEVFHLVTPMALHVLNRDPALLHRLERHFSEQTRLSQVLTSALKMKGLVLEEFGNPLKFYGVRTNHSEKERTDYQALVDDFRENPTDEDPSLR
ncbi:MAG: hypothetical protein HQ596_08375 [Candidatus Saganbacteria bacterium]|nr:hypothetical protein [Candidatus Saganbacteria bacterium]